MLLMAVSVAAITVYVGLYLLTYDANGLGRIPFGDVGESTKIEINVDPDSESIPWDIPAALTDALDRSEIAPFKHYFTPLRHLDVKVRSTAHRFGLSDYHPIRNDDGTICVICDD